MHLPDSTKTPERIAKELSEDLFESIQANDLRGLRKAIECGADIDSRGNYNRTPCMQAALQHDTDCLAILIAAGADMDLRDVAGITALMISSANCRQDIANMLIDAGADTQLRCDMEKQAIGYLVESLSYLRMSEDARAPLSTLHARLLSCSERTILGQAPAPLETARRPPTL